ncbi:MAG: tRNA (N6-threonylcarbamoyladenosine(37)-N6)-methyltransferase TrmO [Anaerolineales bacterium]
MRKIEYQVIGTIHSPHQTAGDMPIQPASARGVEGEVHLTEEFADGLQDLAGFSHVILLYHFHQTEEPRLRVVPFLDQVERGVFATRAPVRPNPIGVSIVELLEVDGNQLRIANVDILDGTPLLDIKPFIPQFDCPEEARIGWLADSISEIDRKQSDDRFSTK